MLNIISDHTKLLLIFWIIFNQIYKILSLDTKDYAKFAATAVEFPWHSSKEFFNSKALTFCKDLQGLSFFKLLSLIYIVFRLKEFNLPLLDKVNAAIIQLIIKKNIFFWRWFIFLYQWNCLSNNNIRKFAHERRIYKDDLVCFKQ